MLGQLRACHDHVLGERVERQPAGLKAARRAGVRRAAAPAGPLPPPPGAVRVQDTGRAPVHGRARRAPSLAGPAPQGGLPLPARSPRSAHRASPPGGRAQVVLTGQLLVMLPMGALGAMAPRCERRTGGRRPTSPCPRLTDSWVEAFSDLTKSYPASCAPVAVAVVARWGMRR